jgi:ATP-binding cassette subfamily B protein/subfamily B ATP-binding cassette protein MsbA
MSPGCENGEPAVGTLQVTVHLLRKFIPGETRYVLLGLLLVLGASGTALLQPWPLKFVLDSVIGHNQLPPAISAALQNSWLGGLDSVNSKFRLLLLLCLGLLVIELLLGAFNIASAYLLNSVALRLVFRLRCALFDHVQRQSLAFHDATAVGDSLYRITWDSYCVQAIFSEGLVPGLTATATLLGIALVMISRDWRLALAAVSVAVPLLFLIRKLDKPMTEQSTRVHEFESEVSTRVEETLVGIRAVQAYGREQFESERFRIKAGASLQANLRLILVQTVSQALAGLLLAAGTATVIWIGARGVLQGRITPGDLVLLAAYLAMVFKPLETLIYTAGAVQTAAAGCRRVLTILDSTPGIAEAKDARNLPARAAGEIIFENLSFAYRPTMPVLDQINLRIPAHSSLALVGPSGTGKTTLASLLLRFYDPLQGRILLDGHDIRSLTLTSLRESTALVTQEPVLFAASIRENIAYGRPEASQSEIEAAAQAAGAHEFIRCLPEGYETRLGERGATLSSGQRQRLAMARAFLKDAPILILDEPTSALDVETEEALLQALERLMQGRTTLIIAHRLSTVRCADRIVVLQAGRIRESGSHEELIANGEVYARMCQLQAGETESKTAALEPVAGGNTKAFEVLN